MGKARTFGLVGFLGFVVVSLSGLLSPACGEVTANGAEETQACAKKACEGDDCPARGRGRGAAGAGGDCSTATSGSGGTNGGAGSGGAATNAAGGADGNAATDVAEFPCAVCRRAENCCKAEGLTDCGYTAACTAATDSEKTEFYLVLCRLVLSASNAGSKTPPDVCGF